MQYTTAINTESVYGITAAREAYNASLPATVKDGETDVPNPALIASDSAYLDFVLASAIESWCKMYAPVVVPEVPPVEVNGVPQVVSAFQAKAALMQAGLYDAINAALTSADAPPLAKLAWETARDFARGSPTVAGIGSQFGLDDAQLDALFIAAAQIKA